MGEGNHTVDDIKIRRMEMKDAEPAGRIYAAITQSAAAADLEDIVARKIFQGHENAVAFVAERGGEVMGYVITYSPSVGFGLRKSAWIALVGVSPDHMGEGIGKRMAQAVFDFYEGRGIRDIYTTVRWYHTDLLSFFRTLGFEKSDFINLKKPLSGGEASDAVPFG